MAPFLSIIIPAYNEEKRLLKTLEQVADFMAGQSYEYEVLVVENGSQDQHAGDRPSVRPGSTRHLRPCMKNRAAKAGPCAAACWKPAANTASCATPTCPCRSTELPRFLPPQQAGDVHIVIASREAKGAVRYNEPQYRHLGGRLINLLIRLLALPELHDTQCGFKCFRADAAVGPVQQTDHDGLVLRYRTAVHRQETEI